MQLISIVFLFVIFLLPIYISQSRKPSPLNMNMTGGACGFEGISGAHHTSNSYGRYRAHRNLCFTEKPRGYYSPACTLWKPHHLTRLPELALPMTTKCANQYNPRHWPGAPLGYLTKDCDSTPVIPDFTNYEISYYTDPANFCSANPKHRLCPNHWI